MPTLDVGAMVRATTEKRPGNRGNIPATGISGMKFKDGDDFSLADWFERNYRDFAGIMTRQPRPTWNAIVSELAADGITKADGSAITPAYAWHTWWRVQQAHCGHLAGRR